MERAEFLKRLGGFTGWVHLAASLVLPFLILEVFGLRLETFMFGLFYLPFAPTTPLWYQADTWSGWAGTRSLWGGLSGSRVLWTVWSALFAGAMLFLCRFVTPSRSLLRLARALVLMWWVSALAFIWAFVWANA
jgi:hypothetical protein